MCWVKERLVVEGLQENGGKGKKLAKRLEVRLGLHTVH
jgi:hypothetical protein